MSVNVTSLAIKVTSEGISQASSQLSGLGTSAKNAEGRVTSFVSAMDKLNIMSKNSAQGMDTFMQKMNQQAASMQGFNTNIRNTLSSIEALARAMQDLTATVVIQNNRVNNSATSHRRNNEAMKEAHALARGLSGALGALWVTYGNVAGMATGLAIGATFKGVITVGKDVENTLEGIRVRGNESVESIEKLRDTIMDLGKGVYGPQEVAKALETLVLAGLKAEQAVSAVGAALNLATVGGTSIEKAATTLVSVGTAVGYSAEAFGRVGDVIAKTAALSMSSVESLSEAFKSASSVNALYGVSLEDIGTSLGILSNLGIQNSAAGTALKNMYKELASEAKKVQGTFKDLKISAEDLKDSEGNFKPLLEVVKVLSDRFSELSPQEEKLAMARLSNERGLRLLTQAVVKYREELSDGSNALSKFRDDVENSYGFAAKGAAQMALTAESQLKSMFNTLKTSFAETFTVIQPQVIEFSTRMKAVFGSKEFQSAIAELAKSFASLAIAIAENIDVVAKLVIGFVALRTALAIIPILAAAPAVFSAISYAVMYLTSSVIGLAAGTVTLSAAFPPLLALLAATTAAMVLYNKAVGEDNAKAKKDADSYSKGYIDGLIKEAETLDKLNEKMRNKKTLEQANAEVEKDLAKERMISLDKLAVAEAEANYKKTLGNFNIMATLEAEKKLNDARSKASENLKKMAIAEDALFRKAKENAELAKQNAPKIEKEPTLKLSEKENLAGINAKYAAAMRGYADEIKAIEVDLNNAIARENARYKAGEIGKLQLIQQVRMETIAAKKLELETLNQELSKAQTGKNKDADVQAAKDKIKATTAAISQAVIDAEQATNVQLAVMAQETTRLRIKELEDQGKYVDAATLKWSSDYQLMYKQIASDAANGSSKAQEFLVQLIKLQNQMMDTAKTKELSIQFDTVAQSLQNIMRDVQAANESGGLSAMFDSATQATDAYKAKLPELLGLLEKLRMQAFDPLTGGVKDAEAAKKYEEAIGKMKKQTDDLSKSWVGVGERISKSLEGAFGKGGKAAGDMLKAMIAYNNTDNKTMEAKNQLYGDLAKGAAGFFNEQSKAYKGLMAISQTFHVIEMAQIAVRTGAKIAEAAATFFAQSGWGGFAGIAAMAAVMTGLGVAISSGGGGGMSAKDQQAQQGTGTVLGDSTAKSDSIAKSIAIMEKNSGLGLVQSTQSVTYLKSISEGISGLAAAVSRTVGMTTGNIPNVQTGTKINTNVFTGLGPAAGLLENIPLVGNLLKKLFGVTTSVIDTGIIIAQDSLKHIMEAGVQANTYAEVNTKKKFFGFTVSNNTSTQLGQVGDEVTQQFSLIINSIANSVKSAADILGVGGDDFTKKLETFVVDIGKISFKDLKGDEIEKALQSAFSKVGDEMAQFGIEGLSKFQRVGEGYFETLSRVANDLIQVKDVFAVLDQTMTNMEVSAVETSEGLIAAAGGVEKLTEGTKYFVDNFYSDAEKVKAVSKSVDEAFGKISTSVPESMKAFKDLATAQDLNTEAGQEMYATLLNIAPAFKAVQDSIEKVESKRKELTIATLDAEGKSLEIVALKRADELEALAKLNPEFVNMQKHIYELQDAAKADASATALRIQILNLENDKAGALALTRQQELVGLSTADVALKNRIYQLQDEATLLQKANTTAQLQAQIMDLQNNKAGALALTRQTELQTVSDADKSLKLHIYALQDVATATQKANATNSLYAQVLQMSGNTAESLAITRKMELENLSDVDKALKTHIYALQDEATAVEKANKLSQLQAQYLEATGDSLGAVAITRAMELEALQKTNPELVKLTVAVYNAKDAAELNNKARAMEIELLKVSGKEAKALAMTREDELSALRKLNPELAARQQLIYDAEDRASAAEKSFSALSKAIDAAKKANQAAYDQTVKSIENQKTKATESFNAFKKTTDAAIDAAKKASDAVADLSNALKSTLDNVLENAELSMKRTTAQGIIDAALKTAKSTGVLPSADSLKGALAILSKSDTTGFKSYTELARDSGITAGKIVDLNDIAETQKSVADQQLEALQKSLEVEQTTYDVQIKAYEDQATAAKDLLDAQNLALDSTLEEANKQLEIMKGTYEATLSVVDALNNFNTSVNAAISASASMAAQQAIQAAITSIPSVSAPTTSVTQPTQPMDYLDTQISDLYNAVLGREADAAGAAYWKNVVSTGAGDINDVRNGLYKSDEFTKHFIDTVINGSHAAGLETVPHDNYIARLHRGEKVLTAQQAKTSKEDTDVGRVVDAIVELMESNSAENQSMVSDIRFLKKLFQSASPEGDNINVKVVTD